MESCKNKILAIARQNSLSAEKVSLWENLTSVLPENLCCDIYDFMTSTSNGVQILTENLSNKVEALKNKDLARWDKVFKEEENFLKSLKK